MRQKKWLSK